MLYTTLIDKRNVERGATALTVVVFSILLLMTISVSFMRLVVQDQQNTTNDELSRGAYDASLAGVEDGKRVLQACLGADKSSAACSAIASNQCNTVHASKVLSPGDSDSNTDEVLVQSSSGTSGGYDQAYSCVIIERNTSDYQGKLANDMSQIVPLRTVGTFTQVKISWYKNPGNGTSYNFNSSVSPGLPTVANWSSAGRLRPPLMRAQLVQFNKSSFKLTDFNDGGSSNTIYLYPSTIGGTADFALDARRSKSNDLLVPVRCGGGLGVQYICSATVNVPNPIAGSPSDRQAYLRLTSLYGDTDYTVEAVGTNLQDVQPAIDSTGRASDVYRRIRARVELVSPAQEQLFPRATVDITGNFCKDFGVGRTQYFGGSCSY